MLIRTPRVTQLDAHLLDDELLTHLSSQISDYREEVTLLLKLLLYKLTIGNKDQSYGMFLMNLKYKNLHSWKKHIYVLSLVMGNYVGTKLSSIMYDEDTWRSKWYRTLERGYQLLDAGNFLVFLVKGVYPNLLMRLLDIKMSYNSLELAKQKGDVSYEFQNRQLIWNTFLEFILFILPILKNSQISAIFTKLLAKPSTGKLDSIEFKHLKERECAICFETSGKKQRIVNPVETNCGCKYCYVCLVTKLDGANNSKEKWQCLKCGSPVEYASPYVDVDEAAIKCVLDTNDDGSDDDDAEESYNHLDEEIEDEHDEEDVEEEYSAYSDSDMGDEELEEEMDELEDEFEL
ncbi:unnamed protein product [Cyberlindnera jadinii]|uniref:RING-type domain-containing protein n=1 Tax=Cyberlindnera jadinii (strain ATCC 18201 / CBS 1600 / BCRC 20928 / JCM 3617 / NBRC 0987 / NRRL Y-1542) TaxID=983966 RepID=A0A0H5CHU8_CYBJN|nr:unnamed protein product [Cyberlindnera jadinii]